MAFIRFFIKTLLISAAAAQKLASSVDYVIVGGGPAGFVVAEQLSQNPDIHVILLEAGPDGINSTLINTPAYYPSITEYYWNFTAQPDPNLGGHTPAIAQGRVFGGGTAVNGMAYCRGAASVFDEWAELSGNSGLAWDSMLGAFQTVSEYTYQPANYTQVVNTTGYGDGPLKVSRSSGLTGFELPFATSLKRLLGLDEVDLTDGTGIGVTMGISSIEAVERTRSYARVTFGTLMENRPNVQMIPDALVHNIGFSGLTAVNVTYLSIPNNETYTIAAKEVIVSSGAINTPKLLMLSGVGPKDALSELGIPVVADIPDIGANLHDHPFAIMEFEVSDEILNFWQWSENSTEKVVATEQYSTKEGPLGWPNGYTFGTYRFPDSLWDGMNGTHYTSLPKDRPQVLFEYSGVPFITGDNKSLVTVWASLVQEEATGYVTLNSSDYRDDPVIFTNYYGTPADKLAILTGYKKLREIVAADEFKSIIVSEFYPGANVTTDEGLWAAIQNQTWSFRHPVGTVAIGKALDSDWRIKGLGGIRVVDSSTFPTPSSCHPQGVVYALAQRAATDIQKADNILSHRTHPLK